MKTRSMAAGVLALFGGALAAAPVLAERPSENSGFRLQIGGYYNALAIGRSQDDPVVDAAGNTADIRAYDFNQYGIYSITGAQTLDNGLELGFVTDYEFQDNFNSDAAYVYAAGGFGRLHFGADRSAMYRLYSWTPTAGWGIDFADHQEGVASLNGLPYPTAAPYIANQELMLTYMTPRYSGLQAGISFAPDTGARARAGSDQRFVTDSSSLDNSAYTEIVETGLNYSQSFGAFDLAWSGGFGTARTAGQTTADDRRRYVYSTAFSLGFGGFDVGASYKFDSHGSPANYSAANLRGPILVGEGMKNQHDVNAGLTYSTGPWTVGPSLGWTQESAGAERRMWLFDFGARYSLAPGADLVGSAQYVDYDEGKLDDDFEGDGAAGLLGIQLNF
ncbi:porin [Fodinicurvata fenggangensis]|uniref:porin n=1 Tax=Fodinicurvata fenggangensis TaxID=1121830 RepID=UPI0009E008F1|nr:porin [Fodinicurvata fenggangensis]